MRHRLGLGLLLAAGCSLEDEAVEVASAVQLEVDAATARANGVDRVPVTIRFLEGSSRGIPLRLSTTLGRFVEATTADPSPLALVTDGSRRLDRTLVVGRTPGQGTLTLVIADQASLSTTFELAPSPPTVVALTSNVFVLAGPTAAAELTAVIARADRAGVSAGTRVQTLTCCGDQDCAELVQLPPFVRFGEATEASAALRLTVAGENRVAAVAAGEVAPVSVVAHAYVSNDALTCASIGASADPRATVELQLGEPPE